MTRIDNQGSLIRGGSARRRGASGRHEAAAGAEAGPCAARPGHRPIRRPPAGGRGPGARRKRGAVRSPQGKGPWGREAGRLVDGLIRPASALAPRGPGRQVRCEHTVPAARAGRADPDSRAAAGGGALRARGPQVAAVGRRQARVSWRSLTASGCSRRAVGGGPARGRPARGRSGDDHRDC